MPLASLLGRSRPSSPTLTAMAPRSCPKHTVLVGIRNLDTDEKEIVRASRVHVFTIKEVDRLGVAR